MDLSKLTSDQLNKMVNDTKGTKKSRASARAEINRRVSEKQRKLGRGILTKAKDIIVPKTKAKEQSNIARGKKRKRKVISMQERARKAKAETSARLPSPELGPTISKPSPRPSPELGPTISKKTTAKKKPKAVKAESKKKIPKPQMKPKSTKRITIEDDVVSAPSVRKDTEKKSDVPQLKKETAKVKVDIDSYLKDNPLQSVPKSIQPKVTAIKKTPLKNLGKMTAKKAESFRQGVGKVDDWLEGLFAKAGKKSGTLRTGDERKADREKTKKMERASDFRPMKKGGKVKKKKYMGGGSIKRTSATSMNSKGYAMNRGRTTSIRKPTRTR